MNAMLKPIESRCLTRPKYDNTSIEWFGRWLEANRAALRDYYTAQGGKLAKPEDDNLLAFSRTGTFLTWCQVQRDIELGRL
jgi:hypothetical protein